MAITFDELPRHEKVYILCRLGLPKREEDLLWLKYIEQRSYAEIAAELNLSEKSIGPLLTKTRKHAITIATECYDLADDRCKAIIKKVDWSRSKSRLHNPLAKNKEE